MKRRVEPGESSTRHEPSGAPSRRDLVPPRSTLKRVAVPLSGLLGFIQPLPQLRDPLVPLLDDTVHFSRTLSRAFIVGSTRRFSFLPSSSLFVVPW